MGRERWEPWEEVEILLSCVFCRISRAVLTHSMEPSRPPQVVMITLDLAAADVVPIVQDLLIPTGTAKDEKKDLDQAVLQG